MSMKDYIEEAVKDFTHQHFQTFYLDVIHREYTLKRYLEEFHLLDVHVDDLANYDFVKVTKLLGISKDEAIMMDSDILANKFKSQFRTALEPHFIELLKGKKESILERLDDNILTHRDIATWTAQCENIDLAVEDYEKEKLSI